jgi:hemolysin activation/secretion protein
MRWVVVYEYGVPGGALNLILLTTQTVVTIGILPYQEKIPMVEPGTEPGTSRLVVRNADDQTTRLV